MFGSSSTTSSRASACAPGSVIDMFMTSIFACFAEENLNVSSGTAVAFPAYADRSPQGPVPGMPAAGRGGEPWPHGRNIHPTRPDHPTPPDPASPDHDHEGLVALSHY
jgi:hypothetical protein